VQKITCMAMSEERMARANTRTFFRCLPGDLIDQVNLVAFAAVTAIETDLGFEVPAFDVTFGKRSLPFLADRA
jgi:hypothetical protein